MLCFTCLLCKKKLDSGLLTEKDGDIFCKGIWCTVNPDKIPGNATYMMH